MRDLVIIGAGGFGREVAWLVQDINENSPTWNVVGFLDDNPDALARHECEHSVICAVSEFQEWNAVHAVCAVGDPKTRKAIVQSLTDHRPTWATLRHPTAAIGPAVHVGARTVLCRNTIVSVHATLAAHVHVNFQSIVGHDATLDDFCTLGCQVNVSGNCTLREGAFMGSGSTSLPGATMERWARVGANIVVLQHVPENATILGVPGRRF